MIFLVLNHANTKGPAACALGCNLEYHPLLGQKNIVPLLWYVTSIFHNFSESSDIFKDFYNFSRPRNQSNKSMTFSGFL